jgi:serine/threonine-protein kinase
MGDDRVTEVLRLCEEALARQPADRVAYLDEACGCDTELRRDVERLLTRQSAPAGFLDSPAWAEPRPRLKRGTRLGAYEIEDFIGAGGMGEVYKAVDMRLARAVAIKVLPPGLANSSERRARFEREAKTIASLNHPHICVVHDLGHEVPTQAAGGGRTADEPIDFLVMEHLNGRTLAERLAKGPLHLEQALTVAAEIADALAAAHRQGVIHRDLKPANVMLTTSGAKLLDFGLAKLAGRGEPPTTPTNTAPLTGQGVILGTVEYMAPEQLEGKAADARTDMWALGAIVYEIVTGQRPFEGTSTAGLVTAILEHEPPSITSLQPLAPPALDRFVRSCLAKDPDLRLDSARAAADELRWLLAGGASPRSGRPPSWRRRWLLAGAAGGLLLASALAWTGWRLASRSPGGPTTSLALSMPPGVRLSADQAIEFSPDGHAVVYAGMDERGTQRLYWHDLHQADGWPLRDTEGAAEPFFSPDGQWLGFWRARDEKLVKVRVTGVRSNETPPPAVELADASGAPRGASWGKGGTIVYSLAKERGGLWRVSSDGGVPRPLTRLDGTASDHRWPQFLPGGRAVVYTVFDASMRQDRSAIALVTLEDGRSRTLVHGGAYARYLESGHLVYACNGSLLAVRFDLETLKVTGSPTPVLGDVSMASHNGPANADFALSRSGTLAFLPAASALPRNRLVWVDRDGAVEPIASEARAFRSTLALSPDGDRLLVMEEDGPFTNLWLYDLRDRRWQQLTFEGDNSYPVWSPRGDQIVFSSNRGGPPNLHRMQVDGDRTVERLTESPRLQFACSWSPDGRLITYQEQKGLVWSLWLLPLDTREPKPWGPAGGLATAARFSPDGRRIAYQSQEAGPGRWEVFVRPASGSLPRLRVSGANGGRSPVWTQDGGEVFYLEGVNRIMATRVLPAGGLARATVPRLAFALPQPLAVASHMAAFAGLTPDGRRIALVQPDPEWPGVDRRRLVVIPNWVSQVKAKVPTTR